MHWVATQRFHHRSALMQRWGVALLLGACALWIWLAFLLADRSDAYCYRACEQITDLSELLTILIVSVPLSVLGAALLIGGSVRRQTSAHIHQVIEMQQSEDRAREK